MASVYNSIKSAVRDAVSPTRQSRDNSRSRAANLDETVEKAGAEGRDESTERGRTDPRRSVVGRTLSPAGERRSMSPAVSSPADRGRRLSYGVGGGNRSRTLSPSAEIPPTGSRRAMSPFGRGGAGNQMRSTSQEAQERAMQQAREDEINALRHEEQQHEGRKHFGRGGYANMRDRSQSSHRSIREEGEVGGDLESDETLAEAQRLAAAKASSPIVSTGRGGKGNIVFMSNSNNIADANAESQQHLRQHHHHNASHSGRGGAGNVAPTDGGAAAEKDDEEANRALKDAMSQPHVYHSGRGGAGNLFK